VKALTKMAKAAQSIELIGDKNEHAAIYRRGVALQDKQAIRYDRPSRNYAT